MAAGNLGTERNQQFGTVVAPLGIPGQKTISSSKGGRGITLIPEVNLIRTLLNPVSDRAISILAGKSRESGIGSAPGLLVVEYAGGASVEKEFTKEFTTFTGEIFR